MSGRRSRLPLVVGGFYGIAFLIVVAVAFLAPTYTRPAAAIFGGVMALFGLCMGLNVAEMADSSALAMRREAARRRGTFTPFMLTTTYARLGGLFLMAVGVGFAHEALYSPDF